MGRRIMGLVAVGIFLLSSCATSSEAGQTGAKQALAATEVLTASDILFLRGDEQLAAYRSQEELGPVRLIAASPTPLALPTASQGLAAVTIGEGRQSLTLSEYVAQKRLAGLLVLKDGEVRYEHYGLGNSADTRWISFSVAKSVVAMLIGAAIQDGYIHSVDEKVTDYLPRLKGSPYEKTTIRNLLQMASGVAWNEDYADPESDVASASYVTLELYQHLNRLPRVAPAGEVFNYNTAETNLAGNLLRAAIGNNLSTYLEEKIWRPFGMEDDAYWNTTEPAGGEFGGCCINATLRDYARLGLFALANGRLADGTEVLPAGWMAESVTPSKGYAGYGYFWWLTPDGAYRALGVFGQAIYVNPETGVVIAVHSAWDAADPEAEWALLDVLFKAISDSLG